MTLKTSQLLINFVNQHSHPRQPHRYWASEVYAIRKGYQTPADFFNPKPIDITGARNIITGEAYEAQLKKVLEANKIKFSYGNDIKKEIHFTNDITLVVKLDFLMENWGLETKKPVRQPDDIPEKWKDQLECEYQAYHLPIYLGVFSEPFSIRYFRYKPSKRRWESIKKTLIDFDEKVKKYYDSK